VEIRYTGIDELANEKEIKVYPNPFTDHITIEGLEIVEEIRICNALGVLIYSGVAEESNEEIRMEKIGLVNGVYMLVVNEKRFMIVPRMF